MYKMGLWCFISLQIFEKYNDTSILLLIQSRSLEYLDCRGLTGKLLSLIASQNGKLDALGN